jgi:hypothetical protein
MVKLQLNKLMFNVFQYCLTAPDGNFSFMVFSCGRLRTVGKQILVYSTFNSNRMLKLHPNSDKVILCMKSNMCQFFNKGNNKITESSKGKVKTHKYINRQNQFKLV